MITLGELRALKLPRPAAFFTGPEWLTEGSLAMLWGERGIGKSFVSTALCMGLAAGIPLLGFGVPEPRRVLYVDGEMTDFRIQERSEQLIAGHALGGAALERAEANLALYRWSEFGADGCNLLERKGQLKVNEQINQARAEVLILDNLSALAPAEEDNAAASWNGITPWLISLRSSGLATILIHHAGKDTRKQRGTSRKEDILDTVVSLTHPRARRRKGQAEGGGTEHDEDSAQDPRAGADPESIWWTWEKHRNFIKLSPFQIALKSEGTGLPVRVCRADDADLAEALREQNLELAVAACRRGLSLREAASKYNIPRSTLQRRLTL